MNTIQTNIRETDNKAQHSPLPDEAEIVRQAGLQAAKSNKWGGWSWQAYQTSITRQNHHISKIEAHADKLAEALRGLANIATHPKCTAADRKLFAREAREALAAYEAAQ